MDTLNAEQIRNRRTEVEAQIVKVRAEIADLEAEIADLDAAERVLARMGGAERRAPRQANREPATTARKAGAKSRTASAMILAVMHEMGRPMEPRNIADAIEAKGWGPVNRDAIRTRIWHMAKDGKVVKDGTVYSLPPGKEKPAGVLSVEDTPAGLFGNPQQGREAGLGGGT